VHFAPHSICGSDWRNGKPRKKRIQNPVLHYADVLQAVDELTSVGGNGERLEMAIVGRRDIENGSRIAVCGVISLL